MERLAAPYNSLEHQIKTPAIDQLKRSIGVFIRYRGQKRVLQITTDNDLIPLMVDYKEIRIKIAPGAHHTLSQCCQEQGYSTLSEFVKRAIQEKIATECYHLIMTVEEIEAQTKKGPSE
jgi:hypothetical protein